MGAVIGIAVLVALFLAFPFITREGEPRECGGGGCWKKKVGLGCGACPADQPDPGRSAGR